MTQLQQTVNRLIHDYRFRFFLRAAIRHRREHAEVRNSSLNNLSQLWDDRAELLSPIVHEDRYETHDQRHFSRLPLRATAAGSQSASLRISK